MLVLLGDFLGGLFDEEGFLLWGSAAGGTCSLLCFLPIFSKPPYKVSAILMGAEERKKQQQEEEEEEEEKEEC